MIVQCDNCRSKFRLDEALVKADGIRVRCSLCRNTFKVYPPQTAVPPQVETESGLPEPGRAVGTLAFGGFPEEPAGKKNEAHDEELERLFEEIPEEMEAAGVPATGASDLLDVAGEEGRGRRERHGGGGFSPAGFEKRAAAYAEKRSALARFLWAILLTILILAGAAAAVWIWAPQWIPKYAPFLKRPQPQLQADSGVRKLSLEAVTGAFVVSERAGRVFVIRGLAVNNYPESRSFIRVRGAILDEKGGAVLSRESYAGNLLNDDDIRQRSLDEIRQAMENRYGTGGNNLSIKPGETIPFAVIFESLPENVSEFTVEALSSSPAM